MRPSSGRRTSSAACRGDLLYCPGRGISIGVLVALLWLTATLIVLGFSLEKYHGNRCPNSKVFQLEISALARWVYELCARHDVPYWLVFGNILFVLRRQNRIPVGDTDSDIAIVKSDFLARFGSVQNLWNGYTFYKTPAARASSLACTCFSRALRVSGVSRS